MHIAIDAQALNRKLRAGIPEYVLRLLKGLGSIDFENNYSIYLRSSPAEDLNIKQENFQIKNLNFPQRKMLGMDVLFLAWVHMILPTVLTFDTPDLFFSPVGSLPVYCPCKAVATIHDVSPLVSKAFFPAPSRISYKLHTWHTIKRADRIIVVSECTKRDIINLFHADPDKISVIYESYDPNIYNPNIDPAQRTETMQKYGISTNYMLYVGTLEPRKNCLRLIEAFSLLKRDGRFDHRLVIAGQKGWLYNDIYNSVQKLGLRNEVIFTGYVPKRDMRALMGSADLFVFPSLYEGFGLPPLEAMACGTPVITSNVSSLPEVVGDAAILVNPYSVSDIATAMYQVLSNTELQGQMRQRGLERAKLFLLEKEAKQTLEVFENLFKYSKGDAGNASK